MAMSRLLFRRQSRDPVIRVAVQPVVQLQGHHQDQVQDQVHPHPPPPGLRPGSLARFHLWLTQVFAWIWSEATLEMAILSGFGSATAKRIRPGHSRQIRGTLCTRRTNQNALMQVGAEVGSCRYGIATVCLSRRGATTVTWPLFTLETAIKMPHVWIFKEGIFAMVHPFGFGNATGNGNSNGTCPLMLLILSCTTLTFAWISPAKTQRMGTCCGRGNATATTHRSGSSLKVPG